MSLSKKFAIAAALLFALDVVGNNGQASSWTATHTLSGLNHVAHATAHGIRNAVNSWTTDSPRPVIHMHQRPDS